MVRALLADHNISGQVYLLVKILESPQWQDLWSSLNLPLWTFRSLGLLPTVSDAVLWHVCQQQQVVLITANRNASDPDSLEATIRAFNTPNSLPVFTLANAGRIFPSKIYAEKTAVKMLDYLLNMDRILGTGRLYIP
ncbi:MAG: ACP S-malonyltransferase [Planctomycetes bacterium]|nr:ACP S-malonyltransferase [Planctomycetota bacterium]